MDKHSKRSRRASLIAVAMIATLARPGVAGELADYRELYSLYKSGSYAIALEKMAKFEQRYPESPQLTQLHNLEGLSELLLGHAQLAIPYFQKAIASSGTSANFSQYVMYNLAKAQFESGAIDDSKATSDKIDTQVMDSENRIKVWYLRSYIALKQGRAAEAARAALEGAQSLGDTSLHEPRDARSTLSTQLDRSLQQIADIPSLEELLRSYASSSLADQLLFQLGSKELSLGSQDKAEIHLRNLVDHYPRSAYFQQANDLLKSLQAQTPADASAVGVLLPLKGRFERFGSLSLQAIEMAFDIFNQQVPDSKVTLVTEDSGEEPAQAVKALEKLVRKHHVIAVIGPLLSKGIDQITQRAQELGVPLVSLTRYPGTTGDFVFPAGVSLKQQAQQIAHYAITELGLKRFAIAYPKDKVGEEASQAFWDAVEVDGGKITGVESYNPSDTDFKEVVDKLSGLYYTDAREREERELAKDRERDHITKRTRRTEKYFSLPPVVDYDAVFIPDDPKVTGQLIPTFAYRDVDHMQFLGTSAWNSPEFVSRTQNYAEGALFTDAFDSGSASPLTRKFIANYRETFGFDATSVEALAYDAASVLKSALIQAGSSISRADIRDKLKATNAFNGITGRISYQDGVLSRTLHVLAIRGGKVVEAKQEPAK